MLSVCKAHREPRLIENHFHAITTPEFRYIHLVSACVRVLKISRYLSLKVSERQRRIMNISNVRYQRLLSDSSNPDSPSRLSQNEADIFNWYQTPRQAQHIHNTLCRTHSLQATYEMTRKFTAEELPQDENSKASQNILKKKQSSFRRLKKKLSKTLSLDK